jgi:hypothetical protein
MFESWRWAAAKFLWNSGDWLAAIILFLNGFPNMVYPGGESAYDIQLAAYESQYGSADDLRAWKIVYWRELWHFTGGLILGILNIPIILTLPWEYSFILTTPLLGLFLAKEIYLDGFKDRGYLMPKDFLDAFMWFLGSLSWLSLLFLI